jgi:hypothetical protein
MGGAESVVPSETCHEGSQKQISNFVYAKQKMFDFTNKKGNKVKELT